MSDYSMMGSFSTGGASALSGDLLTKLRDAEEASIISPIDTKIENWDLELEKITEIKTKIAEFEETMGFFDINSNLNAFDQILAETTGDDVVFDAVDMSGLEEGTTSISVSQLAQKDVYQSKQLIGINADTDTISGDSLSVQVGTNTAYTFDTAGKTYQAVVDEINGKEDLQASLEKVGTTGGDDIYRLVIKSTETGVDNALTITQNNLDLGFGDMKSGAIPGDYTDPMPANGQFSIDGVVVISDTSNMSYDDLITEIEGYDDNGRTFTVTKDDKMIQIKASDGQSFTASLVDQDGDETLAFSSSSQTLEAQNLKANIDGIDYDMASNTIDLQENLKMTAVKISEVGETTNITITKDTSSIVPVIEQMVLDYNELTEMINEELSSPESTIQDKSTLKTILNDVKNMLFASYGAETPIFGTTVDDDGDIVYKHSNVTNNDKNVFNYGFELDQYGILTIDTEKLSTSLADNSDDLKNLFVGSYENNGLGTQLKEYLTGLDGWKGMLSNYSESMDTRKTDLEELREKEIKTLDSKYQIMAESFSAYGAMITQMESAFGGMSMMIEQSVSGS